jgi:hypothetical protein
MTAIRRSRGHLYGSTLLLLLLVGCGGGEPATAPSDGAVTGTLGVIDVRLSTFDAGGIEGSAQAMVLGGGRLEDLEDIAALFMTLDAVRIYPAGADTSAGEPIECNYLEFPIEPLTVDVTELDATLTELLGTLTVPEGDYTHLAIHVAELWAENTAGELVEVRLPGESEPLLKVLVPFSVVGGEVTEIVLAVDLARSLREVPPGSGEYLMIPVLRGDVTWGPGPGHHHQEGGPHHGENPGQGEHQAGGQGSGGEGNGEGQGGAGMGGQGAGGECTGG